MEWKYRARIYGDTHRPDFPISDDVIPVGKIFFLLHIMTIRSRTLENSTVPNNGFA